MNKTKALVCLILLALCVANTNGQWWRSKCRALVLEGGGDKGAYQVGAIKGLVENLPAKDVKYDVVSGVSIGAINAVGIGLFEKGKENEAADFMIDFWKNLTASEVYANWPGWIIEGAFWRTGLYNNTRFVDFLMKNVPMNKIHRKVTVGATNARTGTFVRFNEDLPVEDFKYKATKASSAFPGFFESVNYQNMTLIDGGVLINLDIAGAIERCREDGYRESDIIIDIVMCSGDVLSDVDPSDFNAYQMIKRFREISNYQKTMVWITQGMANFPEVKFRYVVAPKGALDSEFLPIGFKPDNIRRLIEVGRKDAKATINLGEGVFAEHLNGFWNQAIGTSNTDESFNEYFMKMTQGEDL